MSKTRKYSSDTLAIQERFFKSLDELSEQGRFAGGVSGFLDTYGIDKRHVYAQRKEPNRGYFEVGWLVPLVSYYHVNARWLLTGKGNQFRSTAE